MELGDLLSSNRTPDLVCPKCGNGRVNSDVIVTWEKSYEPGRQASDKKVVRSTIKTSYDVDEDLLMHICGLCEYEWTEEILKDEPAVVVGDAAFAALDHLRQTHFGDPKEPVTLEEEDQASINEKFLKMIREQV